jgi:hypothetical protein
MKGKHAGRLATPGLIESSSEKRRRYAGSLQPGTVTNGTMLLIGFAASDSLRFGELCSALRRPAADNQKHDPRTSDSA